MNKTGRPWYAVGEHVTIQLPNWGLAGGHHDTHAIIETVIARPGGGYRYEVRLTPDAKYPVLVNEEDMWVWPSTGPATINQEADQEADHE